MNKALSEREKAILVDVSATLDALNGTDGCPESTLYLAMESNLERWERCKRVLVNAGFATFAHHWAQLTDKGKSAAERIAAVVNK